MNKKKLTEEEKKNKLEEYRQIRAEIRHYLERRSLNIKYAITITLGVIGLGFGIQNSYIFFASSIIIITLWLDEIRRIKAVFRAGAYVEVIIEKQLPGLHWETLGSKHKIQTSIIGRLFSNLEYPILFLLNSVSGVISLKINDNTPFYISIVAIILLIIILLILSIRSYLVLSRGRKIEVENWEKT